MRSNMSAIQHGGGFEPGHEETDNPDLSPHDEDISEENDDESFYDFSDDDVDKITDKPAYFMAPVQIISKKAEEGILEGKFGLESATEFLNEMWKVVKQRKAMLGRKDDDMEDFLHRRVAEIPVRAAINGWTQANERLYDSRQTLLYAFCVLSVFPDTIQRDTTGLVISTKGVLELYRLLLQLIRVATIKGAGEQTLMQLKDWIKKKRPVTAFLIAQYEHLEEMSTKLRDANVSAPTTGIMDTVLTGERRGCNSEGA